ncbi:MAG: hypothetical protein STSR0008_13020 [Ignavibacterium sp.]
MLLTTENSKLKYLVNGKLISIKFMKKRTIAFERKNLSLINDFINLL